MNAFNFDEIREEIKQMREDVAEGMKCELCCMQDGKN